METKFCHACKLDLPLISFGKNRTTKDGLQGQCRSCRSERQKNSKEYKEYQRRYVETNKERLSEYAKAKYRENPEPAKARAREWRGANPERKKELDRLWNQNNRDRVNKNSREWARKNRERRREICRKYDIAHKEESRIRAAQRRAKMQSNGFLPYTKEQLLGKLLVWKYICYLCGGHLDDTLEWDHVKPIAKGGADILANLRPTHSLCNRKKGAEWPMTARWGSKDGDLLWSSDFVLVLT